MHGGTCMINKLIGLAFVLTIIFAVTVTILRHLNSDKTIDARLAKVISEDMAENARFKDHFVGFKLVEPGHYEVETIGLTDAHEAGTFAYNSMILLVTTNWKIQTSFSIFTISGQQDGVQIFQVTNDEWGRPSVTLMGPFEGIEYVPTFSKMDPLYPEIESESIVGKIPTTAGFQPL